MKPEALPRLHGSDDRIRKRLQGMAVQPHLLDWDAACRDFSWDQARQAMANVEAALQVFGADLQSAVKLTVFLVDADDYGKFKELREELFDEPYPASTLLLGTPVFPEMLIEVEAVASLSGPREPLN